MPTNTTSPFVSARAAVTAMISFGVYSESIVHAGCYPGRRAQTILQARQRREIRRAVAHAVDELVEIPRELLRIARDRLPAHVERIVAIIVALGVRRMRAPGLDDDGVDDHS